MFKKTQFSLLTYWGQLVIFLRKGIFCPYYQVFKIMPDEVKPAISAKVVLVLKGQRKQELREQIAEITQMDPLAKSMIMAQLIEHLVGIGAREELNRLRAKEATKQQTV